VLATLLLVLVEAALCFRSRLPPEPVYQGKGLSSWMRDLNNLQYGPAPTNVVLAVQQMGTDAVPFLVEQLKSKDSTLVTCCKRLLVGQRHGIAVDLQFDYEVRQQTLTCLSILGPAAKAAIPDVVSHLGDPDDSWSAANALYHIGADAIPALQSAATNQDPEVRSYAVETLSRLHCTNIIPTLLTRLRSPYPGHRAEAAQLLANFPDHAGVIAPALTEALDDPSPDVRYWAIRSLAPMGTPAKVAVPKLLKLITRTSEINLQDVAYTLKQLDSDRALAALTNNLASPDVDRRQKSVQALQMFGPGSATAVSALLKCFQDPDRDVRLIAAWPFTQFGEAAKSATPNLLASLNDNQGDPQMMQTLYAALHSVNPAAAANWQDAHPTTQLAASVSTVESR
jgi:HEAT repeat protein